MKLGDIIALVVVSVFLACALSMFVAYTWSTIKLLLSNGKDKKER